MGFFNYSGPAFVLKCPPKMGTEKIRCCPNKECKKYGAKDAFNSTFCPQCGTKLDLVEVERSLGASPYLWKINDMLDYHKTSSRRGLNIYEVESPDGAEVCFILYGNSPHSASPDQDEHILFFNEVNIPEEIARFNEVYSDIDELLVEEFGADHLKIHWVTITYATNDDEY